MAIEVNSGSYTCHKCGKSFSRRRSFFPASHGMQHKGTGYLPVCRDCVEHMYNQYLSVCNDPKIAVRQMCRKLDVYWNEKKYDEAEAMHTPRTVMTHYLQKICTHQFAGKSYDDTLLEEGILWRLSKDDFETKEIEVETEEPIEDIVDEPENDEVEISDEIISFWGNSFDKKMYLELEQRKKYWMDQLPEDMDMNIGTVTLIKHACIQELDINNNIANGKAVDKGIKSLNDILGSLNLKPIQQNYDGLNQELASTPLGVWLFRYEKDLPLPEIDPQLKDVNKVKKYVFTWMGHLCKMMGVKNAYTRLYEEEIERLRVEKPEYEDEESLMYDSYSEGDILDE